MWFTMWSYEKEKGSYESPNMCEFYIRVSQCCEIVVSWDTISFICSIMRYYFVYMGRDVTKYSQYESRCN